MAESGNVEEDGEIEDLQKAVKLNGRYVDPWGTATMPSKIDVLRWRCTEKNERGVGGTWKDLFRFKTEVSLTLYKFKNVCRLNIPNPILDRSASEMI